MMNERRHCTEENPVCVGCASRVFTHVTRFTSESNFPYHHTIESFNFPHPSYTTMSSSSRKKPEELRSQQWFGRQDRDGFAYRSWVKGKGVPHDQFDGRPVIGICNTFSELTPCNSHFRP